MRSGNAILENRTTGARWPLEPSVLYCVGPKDRYHIIRHEPSDMRIISVFNRPIGGKETHDEDGAYPPTGDIPPGKECMFVKTIEDVRKAGMERTVAGGGRRETLTLSISLTRVCMTCSS